MSYQNFHQNSASPLLGQQIKAASNSAFLQKAEELSENCLRSTKHILPHIGRFALVATFVEDGFRMYFQWGEQRDYISSTWSCGWFLSVLFVFLNMVVQIGASALVLARKHVVLSCYSLFGIILLQTVAYSIMWDLKFLARSLALVGAVLLLLADAQKDAKNLFAGVPMLNDPANAKKSYMQLSGRVLLVLMFLSLLKFNLGAFEIIRNVIGITLIGLIAVGFKTKLVSVVMVIWLLALSVAFNDFWRHRSSSIMYDFKKYDFFQTMTVIGGLLILIVIGPGGMSVDDRKKMY